MSLLVKRFLFSGLIAAGMFSNPSWASTATCNNSPSHEAFNIEGLKSELMVTALSCQAQNQYNAFINQFLPIVSSEEVKLKGYFRSSYGKRSGKAYQKAYDDYITQLANVQSSQGLKAGTIFCIQRMSMFDEIKPLKTASELSQYAEAKDILQPASYEICQAPATHKKGKVVRKRRITRKAAVHKK